MSYNLVHLSQRHPLLTPCCYCEMYIFFQPLTNQEFITYSRTESSDSMSSASLVKPSFFTVPYISTIKQSKRVYLITLGNYRFLQHSCGRRVNFPRETVNVIEVSAAGIFGLQRLWEQQVVPQPVMEVSFSLM